MSSLICSSLTPMDEIVYGNRVSLSVLVEVESMQGECLEVSNKVCLE